MLARAEREKGHPAGMVLVGPAGVGKTRLVREALRQAEAAGTPTLLAIATRSAADLPYGALSPVLARAAVPQRAESVTQWHQEVADALRDGERRTVLAIDDAHLLDPAGAALVLHLALTGAVTVLASIRRGEEAPDAVTALWRDALTQRIDLQPFSVTETEDFLSAVLGGRVEPATAREFARVSGGNVLYAAELVRGSVQAGALRQDGDVWRWDGRIVLAPRLVDAVRRRFGRLTDDRQVALAAVALAEPLSLPLAERIIGRDALTGLGAAGLITTAAEDGRPRCRVTHPLFGEVALDMVGPLVRRDLCRELADGLRSLPDRSDHETLRLATWLLDLEADPGADLLEDAALAANRSFDFALAQRLAQAAPDPARPGVAVQLARAWNGTNRFDDARRALTAAEPALTHASAQVREHYLMAAYTAWYMGGGRRDETLGMLERFEHAQDAHEAEGWQLRALATTYRSNVLLDDGRLDEAVAATEAVLSRADEASAISVVVSLETAAEALAYLGQVPRARGLHERLRALAATGPPEARRGWITSTLQEVLCLTFDDEIDRAAQLARRIMVETADVADPEMTALVGLVAGATALQHGRPVAAEAMLADAAHAYTKADIGNAASWVRTLQAQALALQGRAREARAHLTEARARTHRHRVARTVPDLVLAEVLTAATAGRADDAARRALQGADEVGSMIVHRARLLHLAVRLGADPEQVRPALAEAADRAACVQPQALLEHVTALAASDGPHLLDLADAFAERGSLLVAAQVAADAARVLHAAHQDVAAARAQARCRALAKRCDGVLLPDLPTGDPLPRLSRRESQIARLAARGLSNGQIAEELVLSVRTVESHLYQAYGKLGVRRRDQLASALGAQGESP